VAWLEHPFVDVRLTAWTVLPQTALATSGQPEFSWRADAYCRAVRSSGIPLDAGFDVRGAARDPAWVASHEFPRHGRAGPYCGLVATSYRMAYHDDLTGLPGRRAMNEVLLQLGSRYAMAMVDVDHFKRFNDTYGHDVGDQVLRMVASRLGVVSAAGKLFDTGARSSR